jgi:hypothetical protein
MSDSVNIDAEYMNRWLSDSSRITSISPKTLYDIQTLIEYYRDIIVPGSQVSIRFPVEAQSSGPRASIENDEVFIPFHMLEEGRIDETIGSMIHELHHIKKSPSERFIKNVAFKFLRSLMENIDCEGLTLSERIFSDGNITSQKIFSDRTDVSNDVLFLRHAIGDLMFLMNAVEDIRIDANTPPNLRKYIDKVDFKAAPRIKKLFDDGDLTLEDLSSLALLILGHHKSFFDSPDVATRYGDRDAIVNGDPLKIPVDLFTAFAPEIGRYVLELYYKYCGKPQAPSQTSIDGMDLDIDSYFGNKVQGSVSESIENDLEKEPLSDNQEKIEQYKELDALDNVAEELADAVKEASQAANSSSDDLQQSSKSSADAVKQYLMEIKDKADSVHVSKELVHKIQAFKNVQVHTTTEHFNNIPVVYDVVVYDTL